MTISDNNFPPFTIRQLNTIGFKETPGIPPHIFPHRSFLYLISGEVLFSAGVSSFLVRGHEFVTIPAHYPFNIQWFRNSIGYMGSIDENMLKDRSHLVLRLPSPVKVSFPQDDCMLTDELMLKMSRSAGNLSSVIACMDLIFTESDNILPSDRNPANKPGNEFLDMVFDREHPIDSVAGYAAEIGISANHLNRSVKTLTSRSAMEWINISRISRAMELLRHEEIPIIDIAFKVGLEDQSYFARFFRKETGMTPSDYRKSILSKR